MNVGRRLAAWSLVLLGTVGCVGRLPSAAPMPPTPSTPTPNPTTSARVSFSTHDWKTDFSRVAVPLAEIASGGPGRDGIPPIDQPRFVDPSDASGWLKPNEPVILFEHGAEARAYPLQIMIWHEIVDDTVDGVPILITFCPLCNTAIAFDRRVDGRTLRFGTTGNLRDSDLVMWSNDPGETWWQQITGEGIVGDLAGRRLVALPAQIVSFGDFATAFPNGQVLSRETGYRRAYGQNPYVGYDDVQSSPFLFSGRADKRLPPMERVVTVELGGDTVAYPFRELRRVQVVNNAVGDTPIGVLFQGGTSSPLDQASISASRDVGAAGVFDRQLAQQTLTFRMGADGFEDTQTGSSWDILGRALSGPVAGQRSNRVVHANQFWFAWAVFKPETRIWMP